MKLTAKKAAQYGALGTVGLGAAVAVGALVEAHAFVLQHVELPVLPAGHEPIRVLHISDLHLMPYQNDKMRFVSSLAGLKPDLVVSTGDHLSSSQALEPLLETLRPFAGVPGVFVFGSNDFEAPHFHNPLAYLLHSTSSDNRPTDVDFHGELISEGLQELGWVFLDDAAARLPIAGRTIEFRGTGDPHVGRDHYEEIAGPVDPEVDLTIGVTHAPYRRVLDAMVDDGVPLMLAGHTHGGQVCLPNGRAIITNCDVDPRNAKGLSVWSHGDRDAWLHVSGGLGSSPYAPYRLFCRPEARVLTLTAKDSVSS